MSLGDQKNNYPEKQDSNFQPTQEQLNNPFIKDLLLKIDVLKYC